MSLTIIADLPVTLVTKRIRNLNLRISPPDGRITVSVPHGYPPQRIEAFLRSKSEWIRKHQERIRNAPYVPPLRFESGEEHLYLGTKYRLEVVSGKRRKVELEHNIEKLQDYKIQDNSTLDLFDSQPLSVLKMTVTPRMSRKQREGLMDEWYRARLKELVPQLLEKYHALMPVRCEAWAVKKMRTKWGTCNTRTKKIWISLMLAKKPLFDIEHVVVHELVHLMERKHSKRFHLLVKEFLTKGKCFIGDGQRSVD
jgi:predicted metal-dependent hydrolase